MKTSIARISQSSLLLVGLFGLVSTASWFTAGDGHQYYIEGNLKVCELYYIFFSQNTMFVFVVQLV